MEHGAVIQRLAEHQRSARRTALIRASTGIVQLVTWSLMAGTGLVLALGPWEDIEDLEVRSRTVFLGMSQDGWGGVHMGIAYVAVAATLVHITLAWRPFRGYLNILMSRPGAQKARGAPRPPASPARPSAAPAAPTAGAARGTPPAGRAARRGVGASAGESGAGAPTGAPAPLREAEANDEQGTRGLPAAAGAPGPQRGTTAAATAAQRVCPACAAPAGAGMRFCGRCGSPLAAPRADQAPPAKAADADRTLVTGPGDADQTIVDGR